MISSTGVNDLMLLLLMIAKHLARDVDFARDFLAPYLRIERTHFEMVVPFMDQQWITGGSSLFMHNVAFMRRSNHS